MKKATPSYETQEVREVAELIRARRTVNLYLQTPVPPELVREAIETATWAPNHHVTEPWRFYLLGEKTVERCLDLCYDIVSASKGPEKAAFKRESWAEKPGWLAVTCARSDDALREQEDYGACCAAVQNLLLYFWKLGIGSKWTSGAITRDPRFAEIAGFDPDREFVVGLIWYGYPKLTPEQTRKPVEEVLIIRP